MLLFDQTRPTAAENLALDEALLLAAESRAEEAAGERAVLRFWEQPTLAVVLGAGGSVDDDVSRVACEADGVPILRRSSGGGTVLLGPGCLCFTLVLPYTHAPGLDQIPTSNRYVLGRVLRALREVTPDAVIAGISDLAVNDRKFSGNAQQRKRRHFLHHGTLLCGFDVGPIARYLRPPRQEPDYRRGRPHAEFVVNLPVDIDQAKRLLLEEWQPTSARDDRYEAAVREWVPRLVAEKYGRPEWNLRR